MTKPKPFAVGATRVRVVRGPKEERWYWRAERYVNGRSATAWTGWATTAEATAMVAQLVATGREAARAPGEERACDNVRELLGYWTASVEARRDIALATRQSLLYSARHLTRTIGDQVIARLGPALETHRDRRLAAGAAPLVVRNEFRAMMRAFRWGQDQGLVPDGRPPVPPRLRAKPVREKRTPSKADIYTVIRALSGWRRTVLVVLAATGCRIGEIAKLEWADVDFETGQIKIKTGKTPRWIQAPDSLMAELKAVRPKDPVGRVLEVAFRTAKDALQDGIEWEKLKVEPFTAHGVRRRVLNDYHAAGVDVGVVAEQLGQSPTVALESYRQVTDEQRVRAVALAGLGEEGVPKVVRMRKPRRKE